MNTIHVQVQGNRKPTMFHSPRSISSGSLGASIGNIFEALNAADEFPGSTILIDGVAVDRSIFADLDSATSNSAAIAAAKAFIAARS